MKAHALFRHYIWLLDTIHQSGGLTLEELNAKWRKTHMSEGREMSRSTFCRHRVMIEEMFDINIACDAHTYKYYIENDRSLRTNEVKRWLLDTISVGNAVNESRDIRRRILLENIPSGYSFLSSLIMAIRNEHKVVIRYHKFGAEAYDVEVAPYCLKLSQQRWYLLGYQEAKGYLTVYSLDRIERVEETDAAFEVMEDFDGEEFFKPYYGVIANGKPAVRVVLKTDAKLANYYRTLPLHHSQVETLTTDEYSVFVLRLSPTFDFCQEILKQGEGIEVMEPEELREEISGMLRRALEKYLHKNKHNDK